MKTFILLSILLTLTCAQYEYKLDCHVHSNTSWGVETTIEQTIAFEQQHDITGMILTNYNPTITSPQFYIDECFRPMDEMNINPQFPVLPGTEWISETQHILIFWNPLYYASILDNLKNNQTFQRLFWKIDINTNCKTREYMHELEDAVHDMHSILGVAHYSLTVLDQWQRQMRNEDYCEVYDLDFYFNDCHYDFLEVVNIVPDYAAYEYAIKNNITQISGSDVHLLEHIPIAYTYVNATNNTLYAIWLEFAAGRTHVSYEWDINETSHTLRYIGASIGGVLVAILCKLIYSCSRR